MIIKDGIIISNNSKKTLDIQIIDKYIVNINRNIKSRNEKVINAKGKYVVPGYIELHSHGGIGKSFMSSNIKEYDEIIKYHLKHGVTSIMPTTIRIPNEDLFKILDFYKNYIQNGKYRDCLVGIHVEGSFISEKMIGAQLMSLPEKMRKTEFINKFITYVNENKNIVRRVTIAPEIYNSEKIINNLLLNNILISIGHTESMYDQVVWAHKNGATLITHLYSSMNGLKKQEGIRRPGAIEAGLLEKNLSVELIGDIVHIPKEILELVFSIKNKDEIIFTTDSSTLTGYNERYGYLGINQNSPIIEKKKGAAWIKGTNQLAGGILPFDVMVKKVYENTSIKLESLIQMVTENPAKLINKVHEIGSIETGKIANVLILDSHLNIEKVIFNGKEIINVS